MCKIIQLYTQSITWWHVLEVHAFTVSASYDKIFLQVKMVISVVFLPAVIDTSSCYLISVDFFFLFGNLLSISTSISESLFVAAQAREWLFLEWFAELFIEFCQNTKRGAVAAAAAWISLLSEPLLLFLCISIFLCSLFYSSSCVHFLSFLSLDDFLSVFPAVFFT